MVKIISKVLLTALLFNGLNAAAVENMSQKVFSIWPDKPLVDSGNKQTLSGSRVMVTKVDTPTIELFVSENAATSAPAIVVFPGGGYKWLSYTTEGTDIAKWLNSIGIHAALVKYTVPCAGDRTLAIKDGQRAISLLRHNAKERGIDSKKIGVMGFSAGGHLAAYMSTNYKKRLYQAIDEADKESCRPDFAVLIYPAYLCSKESSDKLPADIKVDSDTPPTFVAQSMDDRTFYNCAFNYARALNKTKVNTELHLFSQGGHGYGLAKFSPSASQWPGLCKKWMEQLLDMEK